MDTPASRGLPLALDPTATAKASSISQGQLYKLWRQGSGPPYLKIGSDPNGVLVPPQGSCPYWRPDTR